MSHAKLLCIARLLMPLVVLNPSAVAAATSASTTWQTQISSDGSSAQARHESGAVVVNGKLYLLGGRAMRVVQMYDPVSSVWTDLGPMPMELHHFQPVAVGNLIYVIGAHTCCYPNEDSVADIHVFNTTTLTWSINGSMPVSRVRGSTAAVVRNNIIYILGGNTMGHSGGAVAWFDSYNPATGVWTVLPDAPNKRDHFSGVVVSDYLVAAAGRQTAQPNPFKNAVAATDMYDFVSGKWLSADTIPTLRAGALAGAAGDEIVVAGGEINTSANALSTVEAMNVYTRQWRELKPMGSGRHSGGGVVLNGKFHVIAGSLNTGGAPETSAHETLQLDLIASVDFDADGLSNIDERAIHGTNPSSIDSDSDSLDDKQELIQYSTNPLHSDTDSDSIDDGAEVNVWNTDPTESDSDNDGLSDYEEAFTYNTNPTDADTDADSLNDKVELFDYQTDPANRDSDADGVDDGDEVQAGTNPLVADSENTGTSGTVTQGTTDDSGDSGSADIGADGLTDAAVDTSGDSSDRVTGGATDGLTDGNSSDDGTTVPDATISTISDSTTGTISTESSGGVLSFLQVFGLLGWTLLRKVKIMTILPIR